LIVATRFGVAGAETNHNFTRWKRTSRSSSRATAPTRRPKARSSSSALHHRRWKTLAQDFPGARVINRGFGGK